MVKVPVGREPSKEKDRRYGRACQLPGVLSGRKEEDCEGDASRDRVRGIGWFACVLMSGLASAGGLGGFLFDDEAVETLFVRGSVVWGCGQRVRVGVTVVRHCCRWYHPRWM